MITTTIMFADAKGQALEQQHFSQDLAQTIRSSPPSCMHDITLNLTMLRLLDGVNVKFFTKHGAVVAYKVTPDSQSRDPGSNPLAAVSKLWQFLSPHVAPVHSAVYMSTWQ